MKDRYHAGFMTDKPSFLRDRKTTRRWILAFVTDVAALTYLWAASAYIINTFLIDESSWNTIIYYSIAPLARYSIYPLKSYAIIPWWMIFGVTALATVIWAISDTTLGMRIFGLKKSREAGVRRSWYKQSWTIALLVIGTVTLIVAGLITQVNPHALFTRWGHTAVLWRQLLHPNWEMAGDGMRLLIVTIFMAVMATLFAIITAVPLSFLAARNLSHGAIRRTIYFIVRTAADIMRSIDAIIWAIVFIVWVRAGPFPGMLALFVQATANLTKLYSERLESIDPGPPEAIRATGANRLQVILYGIVPQIINPYLSFTLYQWDINVRMSTIIGLVGAGGIGQMLIQYMRIWDYSNAGMMMLLIMVTVWLIDYTSSRLRAKLS